MANQLLTRTSEVGARYVLVTSVGEGAGRTEAVKALRDELEILIPGEVAVASFERLRDIDTERLAEWRLVLVDGPPATHSDALLDIPREWAQCFDASILVVVKRRTRRSELADTSEWLGSQGMPVIGLIWNEYVLPPWSDWWMLMKRGLRGRRGRPERQALPAPSEDTL